MRAITLPYPPSVNHYWRHYRGRTVISREGRAFRENVRALLSPEPPPPPEATPEEATAETATGPALGGHGPRKPPAGGRIALAMDAFPPDRRRRDLVVATSRRIDWLFS